MKTLLSSLEVVDMKTPVGEVLDMAQKIIADNMPPVSEDNIDNDNTDNNNNKKKKKKGRCRNIDDLAAEDFKFRDMPEERQCPHCGATALKKSAIEYYLKTQRTVMKADEGIAAPIRADNYWCPHCKAFHTVSQGGDYPISPTRTMGLKPIVQSFYLHYLGMALNRAGASFENGALLGSDTLNRNAYEWGLIFIMPLYQALLKKMKEQRIIAADETCYDVTQPMGYGKKPKNQKDGATCAQTYVLSLGTVFRSDVQLHAYALLEGRGAEAIGAFLDATFKFIALVTDAYPAYDKVLENHPDCDHQICLIHFRRYLMRGGSNAQAAREFMALSPERQVAVMERFKKENGVFYKEARIYQAISHIYLWEKEVVKTRGDPSRLSEIRKKQTALMDLIDKLMDELCEGRVKQSKKGGAWSAVSSADPLAKACTFYRNHRDKLRCFLKEDNYEIPPDSSVIEQNIRPIALIRNNSHFFTNADCAKVALAVFSIFRTLEKNHIDPLEWMDKYCRELFEHITARGLDRLYLDTVDFSKTRITVRQEPKLGEKAGPYCLSSYAADFDFDSKINDIVETGIKNRKKLAEAQAQ